MSITTQVILSNLNTDSMMEGNFMEYGTWTFFQALLFSWNGYIFYPSLRLCHYCVPSPPHDNHIPIDCLVRTTESSHELHQHN